MRFITRCIDFLFYSNIWIAGAAAALYFYSKYYFTSDLSFDWVGLFVFFTCIWLYSLHRFVGLRRVDLSDGDYRYRQIYRYRVSFQIIAIFSFAASLVLVTQLSWWQVLVLLIPGILSLLYVLPVFPKQLRLRDFHYIKLFIISFVWAALTVLLPLDHCSDCHSYFTIFLLFLERAMFIFAMTLPFDIRDLSVDRADGVKTLATALGIQGVWFTALLLLVFSSCLYIYLYITLQIGEPILYIHLTTNCITLLSVFIALWRKHDWYFTGLLDGTMFMPFLFLCWYLVG